MLGNDIVDLRDPDAQPASFRPRFDDRVFSASERSLFAEDANPLARRWAHWAAKEAAYKLAKQIDSDFVFAPGRLVANYDDARKIHPSEMRTLADGQSQNRGEHRRERRGHLELPTTLRGGIRGLALRSFESDEWVHVVAAPSGCDWGTVLMAVEPLEHTAADPSRAVREMAVRQIGRKLEVGMERLSIGREDRIPFVELDGNRAPYSLSLSHHGNWIGFAVSLVAGRSRSAFWAGRNADATGRSAGGTCAP